MPRLAPSAPALLVLILVGCGGPEPEPTASEDGTSVRRSEPSPAPGAEAGAPMIALILPDDPTDRAGRLEQGILRETAKRNVPFESVTPEEGGDQADAIRDAARTGASALIVVPGDPGAIAPALADAAGRGVKAVSILEPVPVEDATIPVVGWPDLLPTARELVEAVREDASKVGRSPDGPALLVAAPEAAAGPEAEEEDRIEALHRALEEAGVALSGGGPTRLEGSDEELVAGIRDAVDADPELSMVLAADGAAFDAAVTVRNGIAPDDRYVMAGYTANPMMLDAVRSSFASAGAFIDDELLAVFAVDGALGLDRGQAVADRIEVEIPITRAPAPPSRSELIFGLDASGSPRPILRPTVEEDDR